MVSIPALSLPPPFQCAKPSVRSRVLAFSGLVFWGVGWLAPSVHGFGYEATKAPFRERFALHLNGLSSHFGESENAVNEVNYGLGLTYDLGRVRSESRLLDNGLVTFNADVYLDSFEDLGFAFGVAFQKKLIGPIDFGLHLGLVHEDNIVDKGGTTLFPFLFPFVETRFDLPVNLRVTLIPPLDGYTEGLLTFQALLRF